MFSFKSWKQFFLLSNFKTSFLFVASKHFFVFSFGHFKTIFPLRNIDFFAVFWDNTNSFFGNIYVDFVFIKSFKNKFFSFHNCAIFRFGQLLFFHCLMFTFTSEYDFKTIGPDHLCPFDPFFCLKFGFLSFHSQQCMHLVLRVHGPLKMLRLNVNALTMWTSFWLSSLLIAWRAGFLGWHFLFLKWGELIFA